MKTSDASHYFCFFSLLIALAGCDLLGQLPEEDSIVFQTELQTYELKDRVELRLENKSSSVFRPGDWCKLRLQKRVDREWLQVWEQRSCLRYIVEVEPGEQVEHEVRLPSDLEGGTYRYAFGKAESNDFTVRED